MIAGTKETITEPRREENPGPVVESEGDPLPAISPLQATKVEIAQWQAQDESLGNIRTIVQVPGAEAERVRRKEGLIYRHWQPQGKM